VYYKFPISYIAIQMWANNFSYLVVISVLFLNILVNNRIGSNSVLLEIMLSKIYEL